jgi:hypothetical protein
MMDGWVGAVGEAEGCAEGCCGWRDGSREKRMRGGRENDGEGRAFYGGC